MVPSDIELTPDEEWLYVSDGEAYWQGVGEARDVTAAAFAQFVQLSDQPVRRIAQYAMRWGMLGLCEHRKPATHRVEDRDGLDRSSLLPYGGCSPADTENIADWRAYSRRFQTFIEIGQQLHRGEEVSDDSAWDVIGRPRGGWSVGKGTALRRQRRRLARALNLQLLSSGIQPIVEWDGPAPSITFAVFGGVRTSLFAALCMQLAQAVTHSKIAICSSCRQTYRPARRSHPGQANYCTVCRKAGIPVRVRVQRLRDRRRERS